MTSESEMQDPDMPSPETRQTLIDLIMGFRFTQMIRAAARLGIADLLKNGPESVDALAQATGAHAPSLYRLLRALASIGVFAEDEQGRFGLTPMAQLLQAEVPGSQRARALTFGDEPEWRTWGNLLYSVTTGESAFRHLYGMDPWEQRAEDPEAGANFDDVMTANSVVQGVAVIAAYDFSGIGTLVDVAGGHGALISAILRANPQLRGILCDAPHVIARAHALLEAEGVADRCAVVPCDFFSSVPSGGDAYMLKHIIHDWDDAEALLILKNCRREMPENGRLLLVENVIPPGNDPHPGKLLDIEMLAKLGGKERTEEEFRTLLDEAGFKLNRIVPTQFSISVIEAVPV